MYDQIFYGHFAGGPQGLGATRPLRHWTGLFIHVGTGCSWLDEWTDLNSLVGTVCLCMITVVLAWWRNIQEHRCCNSTFSGMIFYAFLSWVMRIARKKYHMEKFWQLKKILNKRKSNKGMFTWNILNLLQSNMLNNKIYKDRNIYSM